MLLISMHLQNLVKIHLFLLKILSGNEILMSSKGLNSVQMDENGLNNTKLDVNINARAKFGQNLFTHSQDIERKGRNSVMDKNRCYSDIIQGT